MNCRSEGCLVQVYHEKHVPVLAVQLFLRVAQEEVTIRLKN